MLSAILGIASFASGAMGAVGQQQSQSAAINAQNAQSKAQYEHKLKIRENSWARETSLYANKLNNYKQGMYEQDMAYNRAMSAEQANLNMAYKQAKLENQSEALKMAEQLGDARAFSAERGGRSSARLSVATAAQFGRNQAIQTEELVGAQTQSQLRRDEMNRQLGGDRRKAYGDVSVQPFPDAAPVAPVMQQGPSGLGLMSGLLGSAIGGYQTYRSLTPSKGS